MQKQNSIGQQLSCGKYGMLRKTYLKNHKPQLYSSLMGTGQLDAHLAQTDAQARTMLEDLILNYLETHLAPDRTKQQMDWVGYMNSVKANMEEIVLCQLVYRDPL